MHLINWILNLAGLVLWIDWRSGRASARENPPVLSLASAVRPIEKPRKSGLGSLGALVLLLLLRPIFYWNIGAPLRWTPQIDLIAIALPWRCDLVDRSFIFSTVSFALSFGFFYSALLLLSVAGSEVPADNGMRRFIRIQLGWLDKLPAPLKLIAPSITAFFLWAALAEFLVTLGILPPVGNPSNLWGEALALALAAVLAWKWILIPVFLVHLLNLYVYLGTHPLLTFISSSARRLLRPLSFLAFGRVDLSPAAGVILTLCASEFALKPLVIQIFQRFLL